MTVGGSSPNIAVAIHSQRSPGWAVTMSNQASQTSSTPVAKAVRRSSCRRCQPRIAVVAINATSRASNPNQVADQFCAT